MIFIEAGIFTKLLQNYLTDDQYQRLQNYLIQTPDAGKIIKGSGGVRKIRWASGDSGKSGGIRVIYFWKNAHHEIWMLTLDNKSEQSTISGHLLKKIAEAIKNG
ncbi:transcriptional regulator [Gammaproteobacteria bacterium LSUCC0112]|nr:transcriptional regulator [Gammaproteobacteria bacterium LSUCC0112]